MVTNLAYDRPRGKEIVSLSKTINALTIDVEEFFQVSNFETSFPLHTWDSIPSRVVASTDRLLELLNHSGVKATFFILGWVAQRQPDLVRRIHADGHEIASHGYSHQLVYRQTPEEFREDLRRSIQILAEITGCRVEAYRAPSFSITPRSVWALDVLIEEGFTIDSSIYPVNHDRYGFPGALPGPHRIETNSGTLWEIPPPSYQYRGFSIPVGGGGYFRLYPYSITRSLLKKINHIGRPFAFYLHPWELDSEQPRPSNVSILKGFRHRVGLKSTESRLARLLNHFSFGTLSQLLQSMQKNEILPTVNYRGGAI